ncbi:hypothetical protein PRUPE_7G138800 [Prunus persica]|uniref:RPW8 domain-containing protein n=1 Tax=Prunus persica TaxID=3760 RepID=A0A251NDA8_PRUPE|nr:hypothetical protein PRUPE_7G138800 [Prunus persica]
MAVDLVGGGTFRVAFQMLFDAVIAVKKETTMFKSMLGDIKSTLDSLQPVIKEREKYDSKEGLENFAMQMEEGVKLVYKCSKVGVWSWCRKYRYTRKLDELDKCLQRLVEVLKVQGIRDVKETLVSLRNIETVLHRIEGNLVMQNQPEKINGWSSVPEPPPVTVGLDVPLKELKIKLLKDDVSMLVLTAAGGCGKTTLAKKFCQDQEVKGSESLLEKFDEFKMTNYKVLVTSRIAFPRFGSPYHLEFLNDEDAMALFHHSAFLEDKSSYAREDLSRKIIKLCKGFPLAITAVGRSLRGQPIEIWRKRVMEWSKGSSILASNNDLLACLKSSIDALDKEKPTLKECFLDLCSFPKDQRISAATLIDMWAELYGLDEPSLSIANLYELTTQSLANLIATRNEREADGYYTERFVTQPDMLRELAIHQASQDPIGQRKRLIIDIRGDNLPNWLTEAKHQPMQARLLSISTDGAFSKKWPNMQLPKAEVLVLNFETNSYDLPEFVTKMDKLKVLIVTNFSFLPAELNNFQLLGSSSNLKRIRLERISIPSISKNIKQLESVQKISLFMCSIGQAFGKGSINILDALPNLGEMDIDCCHELVELPVEVCDLIHLKKLSITNCHNLSALPEKIGKLLSLEVLRLRSCTDLLELPSSIRNLKKLNFLDISFCFSITQLPEHIGEICSLKKLNMRQCSRLQDLPASVLDLEQLKDVICDEETELLWEPFLPFLKNIHIKVVKEDNNLNWLHKLRS